MLCPVCGKELPENAVLCCECGYKLDNTQSTAETTAFKPQKKSHKKAIIITSVAVAGAVAVGVPVFLAVRNNAEKQYIKDNPTKYLADSVTRYLDYAEKDNGAYNFAKGIYKSGGLKFTFNDQSTDISAYAGYDSDKKQVYLDASGKISILGSEQNINLKSYVDTDSFNIDYDYMDTKGSYFIDFQNLKSDFAGSVFADKDSSLYNAEFEKMINDFDKSYGVIKDDSQMKQDFEDTVSNICKSFEKNGHVGLQNKKVTVAQKEYSADVITYNFNSDDLGGLLDECKNYLVDYIRKYKDSLFSTYDEVSSGDIEEQFNSSVNSMKNSIPQDITIKFEFCILPDSRQMLKAEYTQTESGNIGTISLELPPDSETVFDFRVSSSGEKYRNSNGNTVLTKTSSDDTITYKLTNSSSDDPAPRSLTFEYNKKTSKMKVTQYLGEDHEEFENISLSGLFSDRYVLGQNFTTEFNFACTGDKFSIGEGNWNLELSATPDIKPFKADKNFLKLTQEELQSMFSGSLGVGGIIQNADKAQKQTNAAVLDGMCKRLYAGTVAGSLNSNTSSSEVGSLDISKLPSPNATTAERRKIADSLTIQDAIDYGNLEATFENESPYDYGYSIKDGTIIYFDENTDYENYDFLVGFDYVTLGELYHN